jgi:hypothetical protein
VHDEINYGTSLQQALSNLGERVPITDLRYFIVAVLIQRESGGNLTEMLSNLSRLIRERLKLHAKVRVLSADGRMSAWFLGLMPFGLAALLNLMNPEFMHPLWTDPIGITILKWLAALMVIGLLLLPHRPYQGMSPSETQGVLHVDRRPAHFHRRHAGCWSLVLLGNANSRRAAPNHLPPPLKTRGGQKQSSSWSAHLHLSSPTKTVMQRRCGCAF